MREHRRPGAAVPLAWLSITSERPGPKFPGAIARRRRPGPDAPGTPSRRRRGAAGHSTPGSSGCRAAADAGPLNPRPEAPPGSGQDPPETAWAGPWPKVPPGAVIAPPSSPPPSSPGSWFAAEGCVAAGVVVVPFTAVLGDGPGRW